MAYFSVNRTAGQATNPNDGNGPVNERLGSAHATGFGVVYAEALAHHLQGARRRSWSPIRDAMFRERPILLGPLPSLVFLLLGAFGILGNRLFMR